MADVKLEEAQATMWIDEVKSEINLAEKTLEEVRLLAGTPVGDDTICGWIKDVSEKMGNVWENASKVFKKGWEDLEEAMKTFKSHTGVIQEGFETLKNIIH